MKALKLCFTIFTLLSAGLLNEASAGDVDLGKDTVKSKHTEAILSDLQEIMFFNGTLPRDKKPASIPLIDQIIIEAQINLIALQQEQKDDRNKLSHIDLLIYKEQLRKVEEGMKK